MSEEATLFPNSFYAQALYRWFESRAGEGWFTVTGRELSEEHGWKNTRARRYWLKQMEERGMLTSFRFLSRSRGSAKGYHWHGAAGRGNR